jgi:hypothetical protein
LGLLGFLLDLGSDGCLGRPKFDLKPCTYKLCVNSQDHPGDLEDFCGENDLLHWGSSNFKFDLRIANFAEISNHSENRLISSGFQEAPRTNASK